LVKSLLLKLSLRYNNCVYIKIGRKSNEKYGIGNIRSN